MRHHLLHPAAQTHWLRQWRLGQPHHQLVYQMAHTLLCRTQHHPVVRLGRWCINTCFLKKDFLINDGWAWTTSFWNSCYHVAVNFSSFKSSNELSDSMEGIPRHQSIWLSLQLLEHNQRAQKTNHHWQWKWTRRMACLLIQLQQWMSIILAAISRFSGLSSDLGSGRAGRMDFTMSESVVLQEHSHNLHRPLQILSS